MAIIKKYLVWLGILLWIEIYLKLNIMIIIIIVIVNANYISFRISSILH